MHRILTRLSLDLLLHPFHPFILGQKSLAAKIALAFNIPLIFYGEDEAEYGNPVSSTNKPEVNRSLFSNNNKSNSEILLGGIPVNELIGQFGLKKVDFNAYLPPDLSKIEQNKIEFYYLGYYLKSVSYTHLTLPTKA